MKMLICPGILSVLLVFIALQNHPGNALKLRQGGEPDPDPCAGTCGKDTECEMFQGVPYCYCNLGFEFDGHQCNPVQKPLTPMINACHDDNSCPKDRECRDGACVNPCQSYNCGRGTICIVRHHKPRCMVIRSSKGSELFLKKHFVLIDVKVTFPRALSYCWGQDMSIATVENSQENSQLEKLLHSAGKTKEVMSQNSKKYVYYKLPSRRISFKLKATDGNGHIILAPAAARLDFPFTVVVIGQDGNRRSSVRKNDQLVYSRVEDLIGIVPKNDYRGFWINYAGGVYKIGSDNLKRPFLRFRDPDPYYIEYYGVTSGWGSTADWIVEGQSYQTDPKKMEYHVYHQLPQYSLDVQVRASKNVRIVLTTGLTNSSRRVEIVLGRWDNSASTIRYSREKPNKVYIETPNLLSPSEVKHFRISWLRGLIKVERGLDRNMLMQWQNYDFFDVTHFGIRAPKGSSVNYTVVDDVTGTRADDTNTWLGGQAKNKEKEFIWLETGSAFSHTNWGSLRVKGKVQDCPKAFDGRCLAATPSNYTAGETSNKWCNYNCYTSYRFVCQYYNVFVNN